MKGDSILNQSGYFGVQGVPDPLNHPPPLYEACSWIDATGKFWLFGGSKSGLNGYCAMWCYDPATNEWTWMNGPNTPNSKGVYGTQGIPAAANHPGSRSWGSAFWKDLNGDLWVFGSQGRDSSGNYGHLDDLWKYNIASNEWAWMKGSPVAIDTGNYGIMGVPSPTNNPPSRGETRCTWVDLNGNFYLDGGYLYDASNRNDLWKYDPSTNEWVWLRGSNVNTTVGTYGVKGVSSPLNEPPPHWIYSNWTDDTGNLWMFGGRSGFSGSFNDMWKYNPSINEWTWVSGSSSGGNAGFYGPLCDTNSAFVPQYRFEGSYCWKDACSNFYIFSGIGNNFLTDLWQYNIPTNTWKLLRGTSAYLSPVWGTMGVSSAANEPGGRCGGCTWTDTQGNFWFYGGLDNLSTNFYSDLWKYVPDSTCTKCNPTAITVNYFSADTVLCPGTCTSFSNLTVNATSYQWTFTGANPSTSTDVSPTNICYNTPGSYTVTLIATNAGGSDTLTLNNYITVYPTPPPQSITQDGDTLFAIAGASTYQWYFNTNIINGATDYFYVALSGGDYNVVATDGNGCEVEAAVFNVLASAQAAVGSSSMQVFPNPVEDKVKIQKLKVKSETALEIAIYNMIGERVLNVLTQINEDEQQIIDVGELHSGMYWLEIKSGEKIFRSKFIKAGNR